MSAPDGLFATKGRAQPVDQARGNTDTLDEQGAGTSGNADPTGEPLPDLFGEPVLPEADVSPLGSDDETGDTEPPPAASLLSIISQRSAARRRPQARPGSETTPPEAIIEDTDDTMVTATDAPAAEDIHTDASDVDKPEPQASNLPVPVVVKLPVVTEIAATEERKPFPRVAALAACVALTVSAAVAVLIATPADKADIVVSDGMPSAPADRSSKAMPALPTADIAEKTIAPASTRIPEPSATKIDTVQIGVNGRAVVSGKAPPDAELIVLHNRQPLGTARSDTAGNWTFSARVPTRTSRNEISIVPLRIDNSVLVAGIPDVPRPGRRPSIPSYYFAQIASLPSAAEAGREAAKLGAKLSGIVASHQISVRVATLEHDRKVYRVSIGGFSTKARAVDICALIKARRTNCLVIKGS